MKLLIIRHADPDYENDTLTERGRMEAAILAKHFAKMTDNGRILKGIYVSPKGRARLTAEYCLKPLGLQGEIKPWLKEFEARISRPDNPEQKSIPWDWLPEDWAVDERFFQYDHWFENEIMAWDHVKEQYDEVIRNFDALLAEHGYEREGHLYRAVRSNNDTIVFFCHFGLESVLLSHLMNVSPMVLWHSTAAAPSSVTTLATEERRKGTVIFRMLRFGSVDHLVLENEEPSFHARFCECFDNEDERHD